jgi:geranylgeranyl pyrophosphate synthase
MRARTARVFAYLDELIGGVSVAASHRELLALHLAEGRSHTDEVPEAPWVQLPVLVHAATGGDEDEAIPLAAACTLVYLGADLLDNLMDDELPERWRERGSAEAMLAATTMLAALSRTALERIDPRRIPEARIHRVERMLTETLLTMSAGQHDDVSADPSGGLEAARSVAERKAGSEFAFFAAAGAAAATEDEARIALYRDFGLNLGAAAQIASDLGDVLAPKGSHDLSTGKWTLPVAHALGALAPAERERLEGVLQAARESTGSHGEARGLIVAAGSVHYTAMVVGVYLARARRALDDAQPPPAPRRELEAIVARMETRGIA